MAGHPPTKCTKLIIEQICQVIESGSYPSPAAVACGIPRSTFSDWMKRGREQVKAGEDGGIQRELFERVNRSDAMSEAKLAELVRAAAIKNWTAAMTMLERRWPERWGRKYRNDDLPDKDVPITINIGTEPGVKLSDLKSDAKANGNGSNGNGTNDE